MLKNRQRQPNASYKTHILGLPVNLLDAKEIINIAHQYLFDERAHQIISANPLLALEIQKNAALKNACLQADLVLSDSAGISWAARHLSQPKPERIPGIDLAFKLCSLAELAHAPVYLLGGKPGVAMRAAQFLYKNFPYLSISGMRDGYFKHNDIPHIIKDIQQSRARLTLVALGMPKQELWIHQNLSSLPGGIYMGVGGSFDVWSGDLKRAPRLFQRWGIEWAFRWAQEPQRWSRMAHLPRFAFKVWTSK